MTDTTDIKALLNELRVTSTEKAGESEVARRVLILFDQLEAERQRAEALQGQLDYRNQVLTRAIRQREALEKESEGLQKALVIYGDEILELRSKLANPVVLPKLCSAIEGEYADSCQIVPDADGYVYWANEVIAAIKEAGYPVSEE